MREYHLLRALGKLGDLSYLYFTDPGTDPLTRKELPFCHQVTSVPKPPAYSGMQIIRGLVGRLPLPILNYTNDAMLSAVDLAVRSRAYDLVHLDSIHMIRYAEAGLRSAQGRPRVVYNWHNIESEAMRRYSASVESPAKRWYAAQTARKLEALEHDILHSAFGHIVCSERERIQLRQVAPGARIEVVENGVDTARFANPEGHGEEGHGGEKADAARFVFVGTMDYFPNVDAAVFFVESVWPEVRKRLPSATLAIVGANPTAAVRALAQVPGITVTGTVPDVLPYYSQATAAIVPLRTGGGTRLKILEAMAAGVPVVSSPLGAEGLAVTDGKEILLVDEIRHWATKLVELAASRPLAERLRAAGLELVQSRYDWNMLGETLSRTYRRWLEEAAKAR